MNSFLQSCKLLLSNKLRKVVVIGNESCDLDSVVCTISLAYHLSKFSAVIPSIAESDEVVPVLNVSRNDLPLKTEVVYYLQENQITTNDVICNDEIGQIEGTVNTKFILVDHHVSKYHKNVIGVVDHRPFDSDSALNDGIFKTIEQVGSCATLITKLIQDSGGLNVIDDHVLVMLRLLYGAIILDTVNFSKTADKARPLDSEMVRLIEMHLGIENNVEYREQLFNNLVEKRSDISSLDSLQILYKDMKIVSRNGYKIAIPGYPMLVQDYIKLDTVDQNLRIFAERIGCNVIVLMGMKVNPLDKTVKRDLGIINVNSKELYDKVIAMLQNSNSPDLLLEVLKPTGYSERTFYHQGNIKASRKQILPLINEVVDHMSH